MKHLPDLSGRRVLVLGLGLSGRAAARFCAERGARVVAADDRPASQLEALETLSGLAELRLGPDAPGPTGFDLVVPSPGVPAARWAGAGCEVAGDVELAGAALRVPVVAITGTNGKSTTTLLVERLLRAAGLRAEAAGNIGRSALDLVGRPLDVAVLEVSSFQLEATTDFHPRVAVVLNVTADHLDRHGSFGAYRDAKARLLRPLGPGDDAVLSADDPVVREMARASRARVRWFSQCEALADGACLDAGGICVRDGDATLRVPLEAWPLAGVHNRENLLAALLAVRALGADLERAVRALPEFRPLPHRMELVAVRGGVSFVDDSKATNVGAALRSLESFPGPVIWIGGGKDKGLDFRPLGPVLKERARAALLVGEAAPKLESELAGDLECRSVGTVARAVEAAAALAKPGDVVLLAPACASLDQFRSYAERGACFRDAVAALPEPGGRP